MLSWKDQSMQFFSGQNKNFSGDRKKKTTALKKPFCFQKQNCYLSIFQKVPYVLLKILIHHQARFLTKKYIFGQDAHLRHYFKDNSVKNIMGSVTEKENKSILNPMKQQLSRFFKKSQSQFLVFF